MNLVIISLIVSALNTIGIIVLIGVYFKQQNIFAQFTEGVTKKDLKTILKTVADSLKKVGAELSIQQQTLSVMNKKDRYHLQKIGFIRYNPFSDTGGDQSFCACLLDEDDNGIIITSLHSREQTRLYAKAIVKGKASGYELSKEEAEAVSQAIKKAASRKI
jgi:hypothetical protein